MLGIAAHHEVFLWLNIYYGLDGKALKTPWVILSTHMFASVLKFAILGPGGGKIAITSCVTRKEVLHSYDMFLRLFIYYVMDDGRWMEKLKKLTITLPDGEVVITKPPRGDLEADP